MDDDEIFIRLNRDRTEQSSGFNSIFITQNKLGRFGFIDLDVERGEQAKILNDIVQTSNGLDTMSRQERHRAKSSDWKLMHQSTARATGELKRVVFPAIARKRDEIQICATLARLTNQVQCAFEA